MKILVVSLLRLGDIVMSAPVLTGLRDRFPSAEIHLLVNSQFMQIAPLLADVDRVIPFEREAMQKALGSAETPFFEAYERLNGLVDSLNGERYDTIVNLTHNRLSGWLLSLIDGREKIGLVMDPQGRGDFGSKWFRYLNQQVDLESREVFHFTDVFQFALGLEENESQRPALRPTAAGEAQAQSFLLEFESRGEGTEGGLIVVQALTSDAKKDWGANNYREAILRIVAREPSARIALLGAPFEKDRLEPLVADLRAKGANARLAILGLEAAYSLALRAKLVLTGDTSIKHFACVARAPVVEISLGSSDLNRTGAYRDGSVIIQSRESCAPCVHSKPCHREKHFCASRIPVDLVAMVASEVFAGRQFQLRAIAEEFRSDADVLRVDQKPGGVWRAVSVTEPFSDAAIGRWIDLACRKIWLQAGRNSQSGHGGIGRLGSEALRLAEFLKAAYPQKSDFEWQTILSDFEKQSSLVESRLNGLKTGIRVLHGSYEDGARMAEYVRGLIALRDRVRKCPVLGSFKSILDPIIEDDRSPAFTRFRRIVDTVSEIERRTDLSLRLIRALGNTIETHRGLERL